MLLGVYASTCLLSPPRSQQPSYEWFLVCERREQTERNYFRPLSLDSPDVAAQLSNTLLLRASRYQSDELGSSCQGELYANTFFLACVPRFICCWRLSKGSWSQSDNQSECHRPNAG